MGIRPGQLKLTGNEGKLSTKVGSSFHLQVANLFEPSVDAAVNAKWKRQEE